MRRILNLTSRVKVVLLLAFLLLPVPLNSVLTGKVFASKTQSQTSTMSVNPQFSTVAVGGVLTITVNVTDVTGLALWQVVLEYNSNVLNLQQIWIPDDNVFANFTHSPPGEESGIDFSDGLDYVVYGLTLTGSAAVNASAGVLFSATFTGHLAGASPLQIVTEADPVQPRLWSYLEDTDLVDMPFAAESGGAVVGGSATFLTLTSTAGGTINPPAGTYIQFNNSQLSITALPELGYDLSNWQLDGNNAGSSNPIDVTMDANHTLQAVFTPHIPVTWTVDWRGGANFSSIQDAINSPLVEYDDIILVKPGVYYENVQMGKELTLIGTDESNTIIDGNGTGTVVSVYGNLTGFTIRNGNYGVAVQTVIGYNSTLNTNFFEDSSHIDGNRIEDNLIGGIIVGSLLVHSMPHNTKCTVSNNVIANNTVFGIHIWDAWNNVLVNNTVENNEYGIDFYGDSHNNTLKYNSMIGNKYNFGVILRGETQQWETGQAIYHFLNNDVDTSNTVDGKPIYYWISKQDAQVPTDAGYVLLYNCNHISVDSCTLVNNIEGILIYTSNNTEIDENTIANNAFGIYTTLSENNTLTGNSLVDNVYGLYLGPLSKHTTMRNNSISGGQFNFGMDTQFQIAGSTYEIMNEITGNINNTPLANDIDDSNTLDGKPMVYWINQNDRQVPANAGFVMLVNCSNITIEGLNLTSNLENIVIFASNNTIIRNSNLANSVYCIRAADFGYYNYSALEAVDFKCFNITVRDNALTDNGIAVDLLQAENCTTSGNTLDGNPVGILSDTDYSTISRNTINDSTAPNSTGLHFRDDMYVFYNPTSPAFYFAFEWARELDMLEVAGIIVGGNNNTMYGNTVTNSAYTIILGDQARNIWGTGNIIFHNNFISATGRMQALDIARTGGNQWDNGYPAGGNYWSDTNKTDLYSGPGQNLTGSDGICDNPYQILALPLDRRQYDRYPLTIPVSVYEAAISNGTEYQVDMQSNSTISDFTFNGPSQPSISFTVNGPTGTTGFCKVTIPKQVLWATGGQWKVLLNGTQICYNVTEDASFTYIFFNYVHSTENVQIVGTSAIPEYPSSMILAVLIILALATALITTRTKRKKRPWAT